MITVPIRITLSSRPVVLPRDQNAALIRFACPTCGQHLSATHDQISMTAPCPNCNGVVTVPIQTPYLHDPCLCRSRRNRAKPPHGRWPSSNRPATLLDCSRCNRWHSTFHRWQTHGERNVHLPLRNEMTKDTKICPSAEHTFRESQPLSWWRDRKVSWPRTSSKFAEAASRLETHRDRDA